jgi:hypothetical protein
VIWEAGQRPPAALAADGAEVPAGRVTFQPAPTVRAPCASTAILGFESGGGALNTALPFPVRIYRSGTLWAEAPPLTADSLPPDAVPEELSLLPGKSETLDLRIVTALASGAGTFRLGFDRTDVGVVQPGGALLTVTVRPEAGQSFPLWTEAGTFGTRTLRDSYANFPNPFSAGRDETASSTTSLGRSGHPPHLDPARGGSPSSTTFVRPDHQDDRWNGRNESGRP